MVNLAKPRKVDESKNLLRKATKSNRKLELKSNFSDILTEFESVVCCDGHFVQSDNHVTSNAVRQLLSSLQSLLVKKTQESSWTDEQFDQISNSMVKCLTELNVLVSCESSFPESITLSALCISFLLINYYTYFESKFTCQKSIIFSNSILSSCQVYFAFFDRSFQIDQSTLVRAFELNEKSLNSTHSQLNKIIQDKISPETELFFRDAALLSGFLNCSSLLDLCIKNMVDSLFQIHSFTVKLCSIGLIHEFHVARLLTQYLKVLLDHKHTIKVLWEENFELSYNKILLNLINKTLSQIDNNWESPMASVGNSVKQAYRYMIELIKESLNDVVEFKQFIIDQFKSALVLPFTCKSKYKKLSILLQNLASEDIELKQSELDTFQFNSQTKLCELPFHFEDNFSLHVIQNLSINSLANSIAEFYKASVTSICDSYKESSELTQVWSSHWLEAITQIFRNSTMSNSTVVQNTLLAHIFPFTLQNVPNSMPILIKVFADCSYGQISLVRIFLEKKSHLTVEQLPPRSWLFAMLADADDIARAECLALLIDEKYIHRDRGLVCQLVLYFVKTNLNIDNASFRQRIICKLEQFYSKVIISVCDRHVNATFSELSGIDQEVVCFIKNTLDILALSLFPGSSFQRKFTALSVFGSLMTILDKEDKKRIFIGFFRQLFASQIAVQWQELILLGLVDKDDKIRRLTTEILSQFSKSSLFQCYESNSIHSFDFDSMYSLSEKLLKSPRHQESHIGGLLMKHLLRSHMSQLTPFKNDTQPGYKLISDLICKTRDIFYSDHYRNNLLASSKCEPLHGNFLALNQCLTFLSFNDAILAPISIEPENYQTVLFDGQLRKKIFEPSIQLSLDSLEFFLKLLTPVDSENSQSIEFEENDLLEDNTSSPSFFEMCQSIESIIKQNSNVTYGDTKDVFLSNDFQLILSMCWLNIKENCFLLTTLTSLFADLLCLIQENESLRNRFLHLDDDFYLMSGQEMLQIGSKIVSVMLRCRHKGIIEASGVSLTKFTRTILRIQCYLSSSKHINPQIGQAFRKALESFVSEILNIIDFQQTSGSSVTRRSAGLALIMQAVLVGEAEAIYLDGIRPIKEGVNERATLYDRVVSLLVSIATTPIESSSDCQFVDLPQSNALHVLRSIMGTSALAHLSAKTVEQLFPLCVAGFISPLWQIRNASLQLFGACITRMLGQKKKAKSADNEAGTTITFDEFASRYSSILIVIEEQFSSCVQSNNQLHPELVPVLALLASFTPVGQTVKELDPNRCQLVDFLVTFLSNPIWKVRMLAAQSLANLWPIPLLESFIVECCIMKESNQLSCNLLHGLMCCVSNLFELKSLNSTEHLTEYRAKYYAMFKLHLDNKKCDILTNLSFSIFNTSAESDELEENEPPSHENIIDQNSEQSISNKTLTTLSRIKENVNFKKSDDIRHQFALELFSIFRSSMTESCDFVKILSHVNLTLFVDIVLTLLEDEEREVRLVGQKIVAILNKETNQSTNNFEQANSEALNQSIAIDYFLSWLSAHFVTEQHLIQSLFTRLATMSNMNQYPTFFNRQQIYSDRCEFILFEREEKNVFAEPYIMSIRISSFLNSTIQHAKEELLANSSIFDQIRQSCEQLDQILSQYDGANLGSLMFLSIWKLPDFLFRLVNLFLVLGLIERHNLYQHESPLFESILNRIKSTFPFLLTLQSYLQSTDYELLSIRM